MFQLGISIVVGSSLWEGHPKEKALLKPLKRSWAFVGRLELFQGNGCRAFPQEPWSASLEEIAEVNFQEIYDARREDSYKEFVFTARMKASPKFQRSSSWVRYSGDLLGGWKSVLRAYRHGCWQKCWDERCKLRRKLSWQRIQDQCLVSYHL